MEQYLLRVPTKIADRVRKGIQTNDLSGLKCTAGADSKTFTFHVDGQKYPAVMISLPTIIETQKTFDEFVTFKSGEIGQMLVVYENEEGKEDAIKQASTSGITPPTVSITKRKYEKARQSSTEFPKEEVAMVEEHLVKLMNNSGTVEEIDEELVDFRDWMVDEDNPDGIVIVNEAEFVKKHPDYVQLFETVEATPRNMPPKLTVGTPLRSSVSTPLENHGSSEVESNHGIISPAMVSPVQTPLSTPGPAKMGTPTPASAVSTPSATPATASSAEEADMDDELENDIFGDMDTPPTTQVSSSSSSAQNVSTNNAAPAAAAPSISYVDDPRYKQLLEAREKKTLELTGIERDIAEIKVKIDNSPIFVVKERFQKKLEIMLSQANEVREELQKTNAEIESIETGQS